MQITVPPEAQAIIEHEIESGRFDTVQDVIVEALRHLDDAPYVDDDLLITAREQADRGESTPWTDDYLERASRRARDNAARGHQVRDEIKY